LLLNFYGTYITFTMEVSVQLLLKQSGIIIEHQREIENLRGEKFNLFSILNLETKENSTHTAFIAELLNPKGSHMMEEVFLELFLQNINHAIDFDCKSAALTKEAYIGKVDFDKRTGGRIDILIKDTNGQTISIENKIYASDQPHQIERYVNFNALKNTDYYLTLTGQEPEEKSKGSLKSQIDFYCLSYSNDIIGWLEECQKLAVSKPVIRESIRQYILLLKKLTYQLSDNEMEEKIIKLINADYLAARAVANAIEKSEVIATNELLREVSELLAIESGKNWILETDDITKKWNGLNFWREDLEHFWIKIEGYPYIYKSKNYLGIISDNEQGYETASKMIERESEYFLNFDKNESWPCYFELETMDFSDYEHRANLFDASWRSRIAKDTALKIIELKNLFEKHFPIKT